MAGKGNAVVAELAGFRISLAKNQMLLNQLEVHVYLDYKVYTGEQE